MAGALDDLLVVRDAALHARLAARLAAWRVDAERVVETASSVLAFGSRDAQPVVVKLVRQEGDEWCSGAVLDAFGGRGVVTVLAHGDGALLLERLQPGTSLARLAAAGRDEEATTVLADVIGRMAPHAVPRPVPTVEEWGKGFARHRASGDARIPEPLLAEAERVYAHLCRTQSRVRLLHGDLHHDNVLSDARRGWLAIDPKGVLGEPDYEVGAALRNPLARPQLYAAPAVIARRAACFARVLDLDTARILGWAFAQAVLSTIWSIEDGLPVATDDGRLALAAAIRPMLAPGGAHP